LLPKIREDLSREIGPLPKDPEAVLEKLALHLNMVKKGGVADVQRAAMQILRKWQAGKKLF
jgi:ribosome biogenesis GTPase A